MFNYNYFLKLMPIPLLFILASCASRTQVPPSYPNPLLESAEMPITTPSPISSLGTAPPELLFTPTPDPNLFTIVAEIDQEYSQEKISELLYVKWLDHFVSENISIDMRLDEYIINEIKIPSDQRCVKKLGGIFISEAVITAKATLPFISKTSFEHSNWFASRGNIIDSYHLRRHFNSVIYQSENIYTLLVVGQVPMCD